MNIFQKKLENLLEIKNITTNIYRIQACSSIMCGYFCNAFIDFMLEGKSLVDDENLFSSNKYKKNNKIILKYFQWRKSILMFVIKLENSKTLKYHIFFKKH